MTCTHQAWIGGYVLDALEPDEAENVRRHIADCHFCQDEVVNLSWIPALLRTVTLEDVERLDAEATTDAPEPSPVLDRLLAAMRAARAKRRPLTALLGAVAAAALAAAVFFGSSIGGPHAQRPVAVETVDANSQVHAAVTLRQQTWGTELHLQLSHVQPGQQCSMIARASDRRSDVVASWTATYGGTAEVPGTTAIPLDQLREIDVVTDAGRQIARLVVPHENG